MGGRDKSRERLQTTKEKKEIANETRKQPKHEKAMTKINEEKQYVR
jgi:hypothetical protein